MAEMQAFYDAITPRAAAAIAYLDQYPLDDLPQEALNLMHLLFSMIMVSFPVECWREPRVPDSGAARIDCLVEPDSVSDVIVLRADRWVDIDGRGDAVTGGDRGGGEPDRRGEPRRAAAHRAPRSTWATSRCCPG